MTKNYLEWRWLTFAVRGVLALAFGAGVLLIPESAGISLLAVFAIYAIADGVVLLALTPSESPKLYVPIRSLVSIGAGAIALVMGKMSFGQQIILLSMWAGAAGMTELALVFRMSGTAKWDAGVGLHALLTIGFGFAIMLSPLTGHVVTALWVGSYAFALAVLLEAAAVRLRHIARAEHDFVAA